ncbi:HEPN domain-containing protein [Plantactinospora endophytica]|uniref:Apea-like HEPN domain-containing protein n=1 Tax=Plantactinospora endophytica TaxID=673535 RepID=A0ABQ4E0R4_9ACTN|nr:HEPN domain-containing protein [Plantactinospora endophytica]GIG88296.1 hypothetical protein Pen02_32320 [Plantactinospora endophytica]
MTNETAAIGRASEALGKPLIDFVLNTQSGNALSALTPEQQQALTEINNILTGPLAKQFEPAALYSLLRSHIVTPGQTGLSPAIQLHMTCGGSLPDLPEDESPESLIFALARDTYPAFLLPPDDLPIHLGPQESVQATRVAVAHPKAKAFELAALTDPVVGSVFGEDKPHSGRSFTVYASTYRGGGLQLSMLASIILSGVWRHSSGREDPPTIADFCRSAKKQYAFIRTALVGETQAVKARLAFTGIRLPPDTFWNASEGVVIRETTDHDRTFAPESLRKQLSGSDATGVSTTVNYDGDVVVEMEHPYRMKAFHDHQEVPAGVFQELADFQPQERLQTHLRLSLMIAVSREHKVQIVPTWRYIEDPFASGVSVSWTDPTQMVGLTPTQLTVDDLAAWQQWFELLKNPHVERISLALSRVVKASAERRDPTDVLVDSVIAWENLFGTKDGEPTLRVTASLALLLESDPQARRKLRSRLAKIYSLRSDVVHGSAVPDFKQVPLCYEALEIATKAIRVLLSDRIDVLNEVDGANRSLHLIMGQTQQ